MASLVAPPLTRRLFLYVVQRAPGEPADSCDAAFATNCVDPGAPETHVELIFTVPCLGGIHCAAPRLNTISDLGMVRHDLGRTHLVSFRVVRSTVWSALPPWLWKVLGVVLFPVFLLLSALSCSNAFPFGKYGVKRESRAHMAGGVQVVVDRAYDAQDRYQLYEIAGGVPDAESRRDRAFLWMLAQGPEKPPTDDYQCCVPGYNYRGCVGIGLMGIFQWCCTRRLAAACCTSGLSVGESAFVEPRQVPGEADDVELNQVAASDEREGLLVAEVEAKRKAFPRRSLTCSEAVAAALEHGGFLQGCDPKAVTPHEIFEGMNALGLLRATTIEDVRAGRGGK